VSKTNGKTNDYRKPSDEELRKRLTPEQYQCTQEEGTERPFANPYWNNKEDGISRHGSHRGSFKRRGLASGPRLR
jgi:peptide methionine sulfoxide reductase MsrB